jgi:prepilin-type N-terminal cleavage/methylation domain-containing protein
VKRARSREGGFTMIELMVSMVLVSLLVAMVFTLFVQMSTAFRTQSQISDLQQGLIAAETVLGRDVRSAGLFVPDGFRIGADADVHRPIEVINASDGPDELHVFAADPSKQARVTGMTLTGNEITVDDPGAFAAGDLVLLADPQDPPPGVSPVPPQAYDACVVQIADVSGTTIGLETSGPWGVDEQIHCAGVASANATAGPAADTMMYLFSARGYRIDPDRKDLAVIQRSETAGLDDDWEDLGLGFTDLQVATRWDEPGDLIDSDDDGDPETDWYSGDDQDLLTAPSPLVPASAPVELTLSVVVRTHRSQQGVVSERTPRLTDPDAVDHNPVGDRDAIELAGVADADRAEEHRGDHIYRWTTFRVDLRNLGVGR